jgi:hypothetical protein
MSREYLFSAIRVSGVHHYYYHLPIQFKKISLPSAVSFVEVRVFSLNQ